MQVTVDKVGKYNIFCTLPWPFLLILLLPPQRTAGFLSGWI